MYHYQWFYIIYISLIMKEEQANAQLQSCTLQAQRCRINIGDRATYLKHILLHGNKTEPPCKHKSVICSYKQYVLPTSLLSTYRYYSSGRMKSVGGERGKCSRCQLIPEVALFLTDTLTNTNRMSLCYETVPIVEYFCS